MIKCSPPPLKALVITLALFAVDSVSADIVFPNADGSGDLSKDSAWTPYNWDDAATNAVRFEGKNQTYTITTNITFNSVWMHAKNATNVFELAKDQKVMLTGGGIHMACNDWSKQDVNSLTVFRGGTWDLGGKGNLALGYTYWKSYSISLVLDNVTITNVNQVHSAYWLQDNRLVLTNGASVSCVDPRFYYDSSSRCSIEIYGGSSLQYGSGSSVPYLTPAGSGNLFLVSGEGASVTGTKATRAWIGAARNNVVRFEKGAYAKFGGAEFYTQGDASTSNRLEVLSGADITVPRIYFQSGTNNSIRVDHATCTATDVLDLGGYGNEVVVENGTFIPKSFGMGAVGKNPYTAKRCAVRVRGREANVSFTGTPYNPFCDNATDCLLEFDDVEMAKFGSLYQLSGTRNTIRAMNGAQVKLPYSHYYVSGTSNRVEVLNEADLTLSGSSQATAFFGRGCSIVLSNGTFRTGNSLYITNQLNSCGFVVLQGSHPYFYVPKAMTVKNNTTFSYELPTATDEVLACTNGTVFVRSGGAISCDATTVLDIANVEEFQKVIPKTVELTLLKGTALTLSDDVVVAAAEKLPPRTALVKDTKTLVLKIRPLPQGLTLIVR